MREIILSWCLMVTVMRKIHPVFLVFDANNFFCEHQELIILVKLTSMFNWIYQYAYS